MSIYRRSSKDPILDITSEYHHNETQPCIQEEYGFQNWFHGSGVPINLHPDRKHIPEEEAICEQCGSSDVLMVAWQWMVHPFSGDMYYDGEVWCPNCKLFTAFSYAEN